MNTQVLKLINYLFCRENLLSDCIKGCFVVACTLCAFISLVWLREQIVMNGGPDWLEPQDNILAPLNIPPVGGGGIFGGGRNNPAPPEVLPADNPVSVFYFEFMIKCCLSWRLIVSLTSIGLKAISGQGTLPCKRFCNEDFPECFVRQPLE